MDGNVFILDSSVLNKVIFTPDKVFSTDKKELINESESYGIEIVDNDNSVKLLHSIIDDDQIVYVPYGENGKLVSSIANNCAKSLIGCKTFVADVKYDNNVEVREQTSQRKCENGKTLASTVNAKFESRSHDSYTHQQSKPDKNINKKWKNPSRTPNHADGYSIYSGTKSSSRCTSTVDNLIMMPPLIFKRQLMDVSDTVTPMVKMPGTKRGMKMLEWSRECFTRSGKEVCARTGRLFSRNCNTRAEPSEIDPQTLGLIPVGFQPVIDRSKIKRITRKRKNPDLRQSRLRKMLQLSDENTLVLPPDCEYLTVKCGETEWPSESGEGECYYLAGDDSSQQIFLVSEESERQRDRSDGNIRVLLAAAAEGSASSELYFCQQNSESQDCGTRSSEENRIIFVTDTNTEFVLDV